VRICYGCASDKTHVNRRGSEEWRTNEPIGLFLCLSCFCRHIAYPKRRDDLKVNTQYIRFKNRQIFLRNNPRKGVCEWCHRKDGDPYINKRGKTCRTQTTMHHREYHPEDPLKDTIELCRKCHQEEDWRLGKYVNRPNNHQPRNSIDGRFVSRVVSV
jgi:hypothetical protein